jgi:hypothetical protein
MIKNCLFRLILTGDDKSVITLWCEKGKNILNSKEWVNISLMSVKGKGREDYGSGGHTPRLSGGPLPWN